VVLRLGERSAGDAGSTTKKLRGLSPTGWEARRRSASGGVPFDSRRVDQNGDQRRIQPELHLQSWQLQQGGDPCLVVRHAERSLALRESLEPDATNVTVQLKPALTLMGQ